MSKTGALLLLALAACGHMVAVPDLRVDRVGYPGGKARFEFELRDGLPNGRGRAWHPNGKLAHDGTYQDGARHGRFWFFTEGGAFSHQAIYFNNALVWQSDEGSDEPPAEWTAGLPPHPRPRAEDAQEVATAADEEATSELDRHAPLPYFSTVDRTATLARAGVQVGVGDAAGLDFGSAVRVDVFTHYRLAHYGVFAQVSETRLSVAGGMTLAGRRTLELAGTYHRGLGRLGTLSTHAGLLTPIAHDDSPGLLASSAGAAQRPTDAVGAVASASAVRTGASLSWGRGLVVAQADVGIDWMLGASDHAFDALTRANVAVGLGTRATLLTLEFDNAMRLSDPAHRLHAVGVGATIAFPVLWISTCLSFAQTGTTSFMTSVGHDL